MTKVRESSEPDDWMKVRRTKGKAPFLRVRGIATTKASWSLSVEEHRITPNLRHADQQGRSTHSSNQTDVSCAQKGGWPEIQSVPPGCAWTPCDEAAMCSLGKNSGG